MNHRKKLSPLWFLCVFVLGQGPLESALGEGTRISGLKISAGDMARTHSLVSLAWPKEMARPVAIHDGQGRSLPWQWESDDRVFFIVDQLKPNESRVYNVNYEGNPTAQKARVSVVKEGTRYRLQAGSLPPVHYQAEPGPFPRDDIKEAYRRGGYIHPVLTPKGIPITDDFPSNHIHHHGIWFAWTKTEFRGLHPDFWNMGTELGRVEFEGVETTWNGSVHGGLKARHVFRELISAQQETVLKETWQIRLYPGPTQGPVYQWFDVDSEQVCATDDELALPQYRYGGMGFRGHGDWNGKENTFFMTSEGITDRIKGHATRGRWCYVGGKVNGREAGVAILCHPSNYRYPQPMRIHPTEPFFNFAPQQMGLMKLTPGTVYASRYRYIVLDGPPDKDLIERLFQDYANPAATELVP